MSKIFNKIKKNLKYIKNGRSYPIPQLVDSRNMLDGKIALITGGTSGIGYAIAEAFIQNNCKVIICGRNKPKLEEAVAKLGQNAQGLIMDVENVNLFEMKIKEALDLFKEHKIDILVNSAGVGAKNNFFNIKEEEYDNIMNINAKGTFFMTQAIAKYMIDNKIKGHILNLSSSSALKPAHTSYEMSKWAIKGFTLGAADILSKYGIVVNAIAPGPTITPMLSIKDNNIKINNNCVKRCALPHEIASLAVYMCSDMGNMIIGDTFYITGGAGNIMNN